MFMPAYFCSRKKDTDFVFINRVVSNDLNTAKVATLALTGESRDHTRLPTGISRLGLVL